MKELYWFFIASFFALAIGTIEVFQCGWRVIDGLSVYNCLLISDEENQTYSKSEILDDGSFDKSDSLFDSLDFFKSEE